MTLDAKASQAALLSELSDKENIEILRDKPLVTCVLPVRAEWRSEDVANTAEKLSKVYVSEGHSLILANHDDSTAHAHYSLLKSSERWEVIKAFGAYAKSMNCFNDFPEIAMTICSELLTNAFYNAPVGADGKPLETDRRALVSLSDPVNAAFGADDMYVWLKVSDPFGSFDRTLLVNYLLRLASMDKITVSTGAGGAGIGLYMVFCWASQLMFGFRPGQETTVLVKLLKTKRNKVFQSQRAILEVVNLPD
jgi:hypothetical protein